MKACPAREEALALLKKYNSEPFHIQHALTVEGVMRWYANELGYGEDADFWATVGLLHDVDFEKWPEQHCVKAPELLQEIGCSEELIHAVCSHEMCIRDRGVVFGRHIHLWPENWGEYLRQVNFIEKFACFCSLAKVNASL